MDQETRKTIEKAIHIFYKAWYRESTQAEQDYYINYFGADKKGYREFYKKALSPRLEAYQSIYNYTDYNEPKIYRIPEDIEKLKTAIKYYECEEIRTDEALFCD